jgi:hypothetical protein
MREDVEALAGIFFDTVDSYETKKEVNSIEGSS